MMATGNAHMAAFRAFLHGYTHLNVAAFLVRNDSAISSTIDKAKNMIRHQKYGDNATLDDACLRIGNTSMQEDNTEQQNLTSQSNEAAFAAMGKEIDVMFRQIRLEKERQDKNLAKMRESHDKNLDAERKASQETQETERRFYKPARSNSERFTGVSPGPHVEVRSKSARRSRQSLSMVFSPTPVNLEEPATSERNPERTKNTPAQLKTRSSKDATASKTTSDTHSTASVKRVLKRDGKFPTNKDNVTPCGYCVRMWRKNGTFCKRHAELLDEYTKIIEDKDTK